jgi:diguanylate cyclase (GGDEF)-like protein
MTILMIAALLTSILAVFLASYLIIRNETDQNSVGMMNLIDQDTQKSLEKYFESIEQSVEIAANIAVEDLDSVFLLECGAIKTEAAANVRTDEQVAALDSYLNGYCDKIQDYYAGVADYTHGVTAYFYCISPEISQNEKGFYYRKIGKTGFIEQPPIDISSLTPAKSLQTTWYEAAVLEGRPVWIGPYSDGEGSSEWICSYFAPIYKSGMLIGLMGMDIPCETLVAQLDAIHVYNSGYVCLLNAKGQVIYHPELPIGGDIDELEINMPVDVLNNKSSGDKLIRYSVDGEDRQLSFSTLSNGMKLVSIAPAAEINAPWVSLIRTILTISVVVILFYAVLILLITQIITYPLEQLTEASRHLANGNYDIDLKYHVKNEIGTLTDAFNQMRNQIKHYIDDLNHQLYHDRLTNLPNMRHFFNLAMETRNLMLADGKKPVLLYIDIIGLRHINRQYGFKKGDEIIINFSQILTRQFGVHRLCRFSGDHFVAVTDEEHVEGDLSTILHECETAMDGDKLHIRVGVYPNSIDAVDVNIACDRAKFACDRTKGELGSSITYYDEAMLKASDTHHHIIHNLDRALEEGWIEVYYQPIVRVADEKVCDEEALARWIDPVLGFISPGVFIPALEVSKSIYKLDLYVVDRVLEKLKLQMETGLYPVPQSINLSRMDFERCDMVEEIRRRVDEAGIDRSMITVEITESVIGSDLDFIKEQVSRFRQLGFPVWMDDFGSGYSSLDVLQHIHFDLIKFDMRFMENFDAGDENKIILTELMNMAIGLGTETVCEGVETEEQVEFLREIGCTRIQGYYYGKPLPFEKILAKVKDGTALEYENPEESGYYASIGHLNLYDISTLANENDESMNQYFNTLPMSIMEVKGSEVKLNRCNRSYREFLRRNIRVAYNVDHVDLASLAPGHEPGFFKAVAQCGKDGNRIILDERIGERTVAHILIRRIAVNPVTGTAAIAIAILAVINEGDNSGTSYSQMAKALASDYVELYYINLDTEKYIKYTHSSEQEYLGAEMNGDDFFHASRTNARIRLYKDDQDNFVKSFTKQNVIDAMDSEGKFQLTYRLMIGDVPTYVDLKAVRIPGDPSHIIVGVSNVDAQMRQNEAISRLQAERTVYSRVSALTRDIICIYTVNPATGHYVEYRSNNDYARLGVPTEGSDFFGESLRESVQRIHPDDLEKIRTLLTHDNIMRRVREEGFYAFRYRLLLHGQPRYVSLKAVLLEEQGEPTLIIGIYDIDDQVRHEHNHGNMPASCTE